MDYRSETTPAAVSKEGTAYLAIELSGSSWLVGCLLPGQGRPSLHKLSPMNLKDLGGLVDRARGSARRVVCCYEAGRDGFWLQRLLSAWGVECLVLDPSSLLVDRRARRAKTDRLDVHALLRALVAYIGGDGGACRVVRVPSLAVEEARRRGREREASLKERVRLVNRMAGWLAAVGAVGFRPLAGDARGQLAALRCADGTPLPPALAEALHRTLDRLDLVVAQIKTLEAARDAAVKRPAAADEGARKAAQTMRLKGFGVELSTLFAREVFWHPFSNRRQVGAYFGLDGSPWRSGGMAREQGISKAGNPRARTAAIEAAWLWVRYQPDSAISRWFRARVGSAKGRVRRIAITAVARKLMVALWRYLETGLVPEGAVLKTVR
jgi:transposase